jgi:hypothetical protein
VVVLLVGGGRPFNGTVSGPIWPYWPFPGRDAVGRADVAATRANMRQETNIISRSYITFCDNDARVNKVRVYVTMPPVLYSSDPVNNGRIRCLNQLSNDGQERCV